jgi:hypothetical protein
MTTQSTVAEEDSAFVAIAEFLDHDGKVPSQPFEFFFPAPPEIGKIISARSSLRVGKRPLPPLARFGINLLIPVVFFLVVYVIAQCAAENPNERWTFQALGGVLAVLAFPILLLANRTPKSVCSYVGQEGVAISTARRRTGPPKTQLLFYKDAAELIAAQTRHHYNGVYTGTTYAYAWTDFDGETILKLKGKYYAKKGKLPKSKSPYHLARMAEIVWSQVLTARADHCLKEEGSIPFRVDKSRVVRVGPGFIEFHFGGDPVRVTKDEIAKVTLGGGNFSFQHKDAKWFSRQGKFSFQYGKMANAKMFLRALEKLMGYRWN